MINIYSMKQTGFSLIEILIGLVLGLIVSLVIMQTLSSFEGQKRTTTGVASTQTNGSIALYNVMRDVQSAGFGLPFLDLKNSPVKCSTAVTIDHDNLASTNPIGLFPIIITDGGNTAGASDQISTRYSAVFTPPDADLRRKAIINGVTVEFPSNPGVSVPIQNASNATTTGLVVQNNRGCQVGDVVLASKLNEATGVVSCTLAHVTTASQTNADLDSDTTHIKLTQDLPAATYSAGSLSCLGRWNEVTYRVNNGVLERSGQTNVDGMPSAEFVPNVADIVNIQAQYGISDIADANQVTHWVNATGAWAAPIASFADQNRIKAVRVAVVARSGLMEKTTVTNTCTTSQGTINNGPCAWDDTVVALSGVPAGDAAPKIDLSSDSNWQRYRYRVFETIIPLRNIAWARPNL